MQSKGFIRVLTVLLVLVCVFYLSFSFVTSSIEKDAAAFAATKNSDENSQAYKDAYKMYLDSIGKEKVYLGYTYNEAREKQIGLGLDLKGGMNVTLQISVPDILRALSKENPDPKFNEAIKLTEKSKAKDFVGTFCEEYQRLAPGGSLAQIFRSIEKVKTGMTNAEVEKVLRDEVNAMVDNSYNTLRTRIDRFGVVAPNIKKMERDGQILLELPGIKEPERVRKLLQGSANLEFYETYTLQELQSALAQLSDAAQKGEAAPAAAPAEGEAVAADTVDVAMADTAVVAEAAPAEKPAEAKADEAAPAEKTLAQMLWGNAQTGGPAIGIVNVQDTAAVNAILRSDAAKRILPTNLKCAWSVKAIDAKERFYQLVSLKTQNGKPRLGGDVVVDASSDFDNMQGNVVSMSMNNEGARRWAQITQENIGKQVAIVLDDQVYSFPTVNSVIEGGRSQITGQFTPEEATDLANVLKSGKMVAKVNIVSESVIGPSLGKQAIESGIWSFVIALVVLMIFMISFYGFTPAMVANCCLIINLFFTLSILASFQAVLTLSGIAGIVLSLGMAVDANVLIFERTKEELRAGKNVKSALADGYKNAFSAIFDSNLTSVITAIILLVYGTGLIKGFATTLLISIICSFYSAIFLSRLAFEWLLKKERFANMTFTTKMSQNFLKNVKVDFLGQRKKAGMIIGAIIVIIAASFIFKGIDKGIDFSGGRNYIVQFDHDVKTADLTNKLQPLFPESSVSVITIDNDSKVRVSTNYKYADESEGVDDEVMHILYTGLKDELKGMSYEDFSVSNEEVGVVQTEKVGPSIASDMTTGAIWAVIFSLIAITLYILLRFRDISFSIGALASLAFTSYIIIGFYSLFSGILPFSMEIDQSFIAAILTIIGYAINDTVVVFDRIREMIGLYPKADRKEVINNSLNTTLTRTIMTSVTTVLVLLCIFIFGGETIRSFTFAMLFGVIIGTLSTIYVATPVAYAMQSRKIAKKANK
ncbi:MAG: protein translocase subunit SecDF [Candidatus Limisoma sp.]|nr:protein translocase subunit SecDF [Candidatus Limisoma sp.]MDY5900205.1 protein translocase subunit SecDF [Candidatus Limisoma sp.]